MKIFRTIEKSAGYQAIEKTFFNSITKKIVGNVIFLLIPNLVILFVGWSFVERLDGIISSFELTQAQNKLVTTELIEFKYIALAIIVSSFFIGIGTIIFMRHLFLSPIKAITKVLSSVKEKDGDISASLPSFTHDEISVMATSYNEFSDKLKAMIAESRKRSVHVALCSKQLQQALEIAQDSASNQEQQAQDVFNASEEATRAIDEIAKSTNVISDNNQKNLSEIKQSSQELVNVQQQINAILNQVQAFQDVVLKLESNSTNITQILNMVKDFSDQTNLLALNASIEAARAGDAGRGFAVVADEVRSLSQKVNTATTQIDTNISEMSSLVETTKSSTGTIMQHVNSTDEFIVSTNNQFAELVTDFENLSTQLSEISASAEELSSSNIHTHQKVSNISHLSNTLFQEIDKSQETSKNLELSTEQTQELLSQFTIGYGAFENMITKVKGWSREIEEQLTQLANQGVNVFDHNYNCINPNQTPEKYLTSYTKQFEKLCQPLFDKFCSSDKALIYAIAVDNKGYAPAHLSAFSKPLTGDEQQDVLKSRHQRIYFTNRTEQRRATSTAPFLLQSHIRDTGQILNDLSVPIYVQGKHWGSIITGFAPEHLIDGDTMH